MSDTQQKKPPKSPEQERAEKDANRDPLSGRAGAHPVGTGVGAAGGTAAGAAAGAAIGTAAGPVGTVVGAAVGGIIGAVAGGATGKAVAEEVNPTVEHGFWRQNYQSRPYVSAQTSYDEYGPAYQYGWESYSRHQGKTFENVESNLAQDWDKFKGRSKLTWHDAKDATRDAWNRMASRKTPPTP